VADDYVSMISLTLELQVSVFIGLYMHCFLILQLGNH
jgi:hypothetical protein